MFNTKDPTLEPEYKDYEEGYSKITKTQKQIIIKLLSKYLRGEEIEGLLKKFNDRNPNSYPLSIGFVKYQLYLNKLKQYNERIMKFRKNFIEKLHNLCRKLEFNYENIEINEKIINSKEYKEYKNNYSMKNFIEFTFVLNCLAILKSNNKQIIKLLNEYHDLFKKEEYKIESIYIEFEIQRIKEEELDYIIYKSEKEFLESLY